MKRRLLRSTEETDIVVETKLTEICSIFRLPKRPVGMVFGIFGGFLSNFLQTWVIGLVEVTKPLVLEDAVDMVEEVLGSLWWLLHRVLGKC